MKARLIRSSIFPIRGRRAASKTNSRLVGRGRGSARIRRSGRSLSRYGLQLSSRGVEIGECAYLAVITVEGGPTARRVEQMADATVAGEDGPEGMLWVQHDCDMIS
jgi:hypothetical protein